MLAASSRLCEAYDLVALDLDGVVYVGAEAVPHAADALRESRAAGAEVAFLTNNASRPPAAVAEQLRRLGVPADAKDVVTSAQASARIAGQELPAGSTVFVLGGPGLHEALHAEGLETVVEPADDVVAVAQGFGMDVVWRQVMAGAILVKQGLPWYVTNLDMTVPTSRGLGPGNGALVELVARYADRTPEPAGKPDRALFEETLRRVGGERPLMVGDRIDTDIDGARGVGWDSLLVLTGVTDLATLAATPPESRPTYLGADLRALTEVHRVPEQQGQAWTLGGWTAAVTDGSLTVTGTGSAGDWWRVAAVAAWTQLDRTGTVAVVADLAPPGPADARAGER